MIKKYPSWENPNLVNSLRTHPQRELIHYFFEPTQNFFAYPSKNFEHNKQLKLIGKKYDFSLKDPIKNIPRKALEAILYGIEDRITINSKSLGIKRDYNISFEGIVNFTENQHKNKIIFRYF